jgi:hypothetical protein
VVLVGLSPALPLVPLLPAQPFEAVHVTGLVALVLTLQLSVVLSPLVIVVLEALKLSTGATGVGAGAGAGVGAGVGEVVLVVVGGVVVVVVEPPLLVVVLVGEEVDVDEEDELVPEVLFDVVPEELEEVGEVEELDEVLEPLLGLLDELPLPVELGCSELIVWLMTFWRELDDPCACAWAAVSEEVGEALAAASPTRILIDPSSTLSPVRA